MDAKTRARGWERAGHRCEYCQLRQDDSPLALLHVEHILPRFHGGSDDLDNLALARSHPAYKFEVESVLVLETFFNRHPERRAEILQLAHEGRFTVTGAGYLITDGNMILGESLIRNFLRQSSFL